MKILVLGAGIIGTTSAWYLAQAGHEVTVVDRQPVPGNETSFANGGQISVSHAEPWANPHVFPNLLKWRGREDAPLLWRWRPDLAQLQWGMRFLSQCLPGSAHRNMKAIISMALYSRQKLRSLREELRLSYDQLERGILHIYTDPKELAAAAKAAAIMRQFGLDREPVSIDRCIEIEPALCDAKALLAGGDYTSSDESGDARQFTQGLAREAEAAGVHFCFKQSIERIAPGGSKIAGIIVREENKAELLTADAYVIALGSYSPLLLKPIGIKIPVYPAKGYSLTLKLADTANAPSVALIDDERKLVFSRLGNRLRIAGTAEFNGYNLELSPARCQSLMQRVEQLFPRLIIEGEPEFWCGLRPATPSNVPFIGQTRQYKNLWLNTGHGTLGWTMACGSGAALTDLFNGKQPEPDFPYLKC